VHKSRKSPDHAAHAEPRLERCPGAGGTGNRLLDAVVGLLGRSLARSPAHFATVWGSALVMLPKLDVAPPVTMWAKEDVAIDVWHHVVYSVATGIAYELLD